MTNMGSDALVVLFSCGERSEWCIKEFSVLATAVVPFADKDLPRGVHVARAAQPNQLRISWASPHNDSQHVRWNLPGGPVQQSPPALVTTYTQDDVCGVPASTHGWNSPQWLHSAVLTLPNEAGSRQWFNYSVGSDAHGWAAANSFKAPRQPDPEAPLVVIAYADLGYGNPDGAQGHMVYPNSSRTTTHATKFVEELGSADLVLHNGDVAYATGYLTLWERFLSQISPLASRNPHEHLLCVALCCAMISDCGADRTALHDVARQP